MNVVNALKQIKILYVEDEETIRSKLGHMLTRQCREVLLAENGETGLDIFKTNKPDIVITDIDMPVMDGLELVSNIRKLNSNTPILVTTAFTETSKLIKLIQLKIDFYIQKPVKSDELFSALQKSASYLIQEEQVRKLSQAVEQSPVSVVITDTNGKIEYVNPKFTQATGYEYNEVFGKNPRILKSGKQSKVFYKEFWETIKSGKEWKGEFHNKKKNGELFWEFATISPLIDDNGSVTHFIALKEDITVRKEMEDNLKKAKEEAEAANKAKSSFLAAMSHEIRTPMNGIIGPTELVLRTELNDSQREYIEMTKVSANTLLTIINDILDFSKIEAGKMELEEAEFDLIYTLEDVCDAFAVTAGKKEIDLYSHIKPSTPVMVIGDQVRLRQILTNLIGNAIKFTNSGEIVVSMENAEQPDNQLADNGSCFLRFSVSDTGAGIAEDKLGKIFESFSQADSTITRKFGGTGLGLTISKQLTHLMNGRMWVESEEGLGSTFHFTAQMGLTTKNNEHPLFIKGSELSDSNVLIVDSKSTSMSVLSDMMAGWGLCYSQARDGKEGLRKMIEANRRGNAFTDILISSRLSDMDGFDFISKVRANPQLAGSKLVVLLSSKEGQELLRSQQNFKDRYEAEHLTKPFKRAKVLSIIAGEKLGEMFAGNGMDDEAGKYLHTPLRILLAEDNPVNQAVAVGMLEGLGHRMTTVENGREAVERIKSEAFDLVFMDIEMPEMNGIESTQQIRKSEEFKELPIVAMTAHAMSSDRERCLEAGMNDFISKPFKINELTDIISKYIPSNASEAEQSSTHSPENRENTRSLDWREALDGLGGNEQLLRRIATVFYDDIPLQFEKLKAAIQKNDQHLARRQAHSIKGASSNMRAARLKEAALQVEKSAEKNDLEEASRLCANLEQELNIVLQELKELLNS